MKNILFIFCAVFLTACSSKLLDYEIKESSRYTPQWYSSFNQPILDELLKSAEIKNEDLGVAAINLQLALNAAGLSKADFFPTLSASAGASSERDISTSASSARRFNSVATLSYELDIYGKIYDAYSSKSWLAKASASTLDALRLTIYNSIADSYFNALFLHDNIRALNSLLDNLTKLHAIIKAKYDLGKSELLELRQSSQNITDLQNQLLSAKSQLISTMQMIKDLSASDIDLSNLSLNSVATSAPNTNEPISSLEHRPDVAEAIAKINAMFYNYSATNKELFPSISLAGSLGDSDSVASRAAGFNLLSGNININLPFLDYARHKSRLKASELEFDAAVLNYQKILRLAANEAIKYAQTYASDAQSYENYRLIANERAQIVRIYEAKYSAGKAELKDLLEAQNSLMSAQTSQLNQKYKMLQSQIGFYKAVAK